jgi:tetratricopeptide (TPR) repeat protein
MTLHRWLVVGVVVGSTWAGPASLSGRARAEGSSNASDVARAEGYAADAFDAYTRKDYSAAVALYIKALDTAPTADMLYNLARIYDGKLKERQLAIDYYRRYARDPGAEPTRLRTVTERLSQLLELEAISTETAPMRQRAEPPSSGPSSSDNRALAGSNAHEHGITGVQVLGIVALTAGITGLGIGGGFGLSAKSDSEVADEFCNGNACRSQRGVDASRDASSAATISTIGFIAGGVLSSLGILTLLIASSDDETERKVASLSLAPLTGPNVVGTQIAGQW